MSIKEINQKLKKFKQKYFLNKILKSLILFVCISLIISILAFITEYITQAGIGLRTALFFSTLTIVLISFVWLILPPLLGYLNYKNFGLSDEEAAKIIGSHFVAVKDKLLNALQLQNVTHIDKELLLASIDQKINDVSTFSFSDAINFQVNRKYLKYLAGIVLFIIITGVTAPAIILESPERIINYRKDFVREAPFKFILINDDLTAYRGDDYKLHVELNGDYLPEDLYLNVEGRLVKMKNEGDNKYTHQFSKLQRSLNFNLQAAGFNSQTYTLSVYSLPELLNFEVNVNYPTYTQLKNMQVSNVGNFTVPEGTELKWLLNSKNTDSVSLRINDENFATVPAQNVELDYTFNTTSDYSFVLKNQYGNNREEISYNIEVIKDQFPQIEANIFVDTVLYEYFILTGSVSDDYGFSYLSTVIKDQQNETIDRQAVQLNPQSNSQSFYSKIRLSQLKEDLSELTVYAIVGDNDQVNGTKTARTQTFRISKPDRDELNKSLKDKEKKTENSLSNTLEDSESLNNKLKELEDRLKTKNELEWQEEKLIDDILNKREDIEKKLDKLKEEYETLKEAENKFNNRSEQLRKKAEDLEKIINETMNEETRKLYEELQKLLEEDKGVRQMQEQLSKITPNEKNLEKELERALELFKRLKLESKLEKASKDLEKLGEKQENLSKEKENDLAEQEEENATQKDAADEGENKDEENTSDQESGDREDPGEGKDSSEKNVKKQEEVRKEYEEIRKEIEEIQKMNQELKNPEPLENTSQEEDSIEELLEKIEENLKQGNQSKSKQQQQQSGQQMKQLGKKMQNMQMGMEMQMMMENVDQLRKILDDLIRLSFRQENILDGFKEVTQIDPKYIELSQNQLKLKNDAEVIEDSLLSLAGRVPQISSFVTREVGEVNRNIDSALEELRNRDRNKAMSDQQFAMTSINNLALLLDDVLQNMQMSLSQAMGKSKPQQSKQNSMQNLKEMQQQLSKDIEGLKKGEKKGRQLSEELAKMAAEQEMIRNQLKEMEEKLGNGEDGEKGAGNLSKIKELMEENEIDLVNKNITRQLIERQKDIMTRMLEAEDAMREQELDPERESERPEGFETPLPPEFEKYLKEREKEIELLKSLPLKFNPFYKKEVNDYFRRLTSDN